MCFKKSMVHCVEKCNLEAAKDNIKGTPIVKTWLPPDEKKLITPIKAIN